MSIHLGKLWLHWCDSCNLPILRNKCNNCGNKTRKVNVTPPGDVRPAFEHDINRIRSILDKEFGSGAGKELLPDNKIVLLNNAPGLDTIEEVIIDGQVVGSLVYSIGSLDWRFLLRLAGGQRLGKRKWVSVYPEVKEIILKGNSLLAPGVINADPGIREEDEVILICDSEVFAVGTAKMSYKELKQKKRGMFIKIRDKQNPARILRGGQTWIDAVKANRKILEKYEGEAKKFILSNSQDKPVTIAFSGGKDSLVCLNLVSDSIKDFKILFIDTGIEFPETIKYTHELLEKLGLKKKLVEGKAENSFWKAVKHFGPPGKDYRWCCKICKLGPTTKLVTETFTNGCITFGGERRYESGQRSRRKKIEENPWVPGQTSAYVLRDWTALHVWLYIFWKKLPYNSLYEKGFGRIGCWLCPAQDVGELENLKETHPKLYKKWFTYLRKYARDHGFSVKWVKHGFWRWKCLPKGQEELASRLGLRIDTRKADRLGFVYTKSVSPCKEGGYTLEASFEVPLDLEKVSNILRVLGDVKYNKGFGVLSVSGCQLYETGEAVIRTSTAREAERQAMRVRELVLRALKCTGCGVCIGKCENNALEIRKGRIYVNENCIHCGKCLGLCPLVRFK